MKPIRAGFSATFSGRYKLMGKESFRGIMLWAEDTNKNGGIYVKELDEKLPVELVYEDDGSEPEQTKKITEKLIIDKSVDILLGPYSSSLTRAAAEVSSRLDKTLWNYGGSSDDITGSGYKNVISSITPASEYFGGILELFRNIFPDSTRIAVVYAQNSGFSKTVADGLVKFARELGYEENEYTFISGQKSLDNIIDQLYRDKHKLVFFVGRFEDDVNFANHIVKIRNNFDAVSLVGASIEEFGKQLGSNANGFISTSQWDSELRISPDEGPGINEFCESFRDKFEHEPDYLSAQAYNIGVVLTKCIKHAGSIDNKKLRDTVKELSFSTFYGDFRVDPETGKQTGHNMLVIQWQNDKREIVSPRQYATSVIKI